MKPLKLKFPNGQEKEVNLCHECDRKREKIKKKMEADPRKQLAAKLLAALQGKPEEKRDYLFKKSR
ncbi:hypothetical protein KJ735_00090 [Patescibacteria group bacterium]|nr:hypothetical protein [Patescibacteria group bacterium]